MQLPSQENDAQGHRKQDLKRPILNLLNLEGRTLYREYRRTVICKQFGKGRVQLRVKSRKWLSRTNK